MRWCVIILVTAAITGCGVETATTAATVATLKKKEMEEGRKTMEMTRQKIDAAMELTRQRAEKNADQ